MPVYASGRCRQKLVSNINGIFTLFSFLLGSKRVFQILYFISKFQPAKYFTWNHALIYSSWLSDLHICLTKFVKGIITSRKHCQHILVRANCIRCLKIPSISKNKIQSRQLVSCFYTYSCHKTSLLEMNQAYIS